MVGFGESFFSAYAVFLEANNIYLGLLASLPHTLGSLFQIYSSRLLKLLKSRKRFICIFALLQGLTYIPIILVFFWGSLRIISLLLLVCLYWIFGMILGPAWNSWMGDLVDENVRGTYFGHRNKIAGFVAFFTFVVGGYILQSFSNGKERQYIGFMIIFILALISRMLSFFFLTKKYEPMYDIFKEFKIHFMDFLRQERFKNYRFFIFYLSLMNFAVYIAGPFFTPYMLYDLRLDYKTFTIINASSLIIKFLAMPVWGELMDKYGTRKILVLSGLLLPLIPLLWIFSSSVRYLVLIQIYNGFVWAGFEIASFSFLFDITLPHQRVSHVIYYNVLNGIAILIGGILGGVLVKYNTLFASKYFFVFIISFLTRFSVSLYFLPKLREVRIVEEISYSRLLLKLLTTMPTRGLVYNIIILKKGNKSKSLKINA
ncbi:MFS transporter [bacterium]|nr:MFS transporter [bacterium]